MNKLKTVIVVTLAITAMPSLAGAEGGFFSRLKEKVENEITSEIDQTKEQITNAVPDANADETSIKAMIANPVQSLTSTSVHGMDVIGLRLGMNPEEVKTALQTHDPAMKMHEQYQELSRVPDSRYLGLISAESGAGQRSSESVTIEFATPPHAPVMMRLARKTVYGQDAQPTLTNTVDALTEKYGTPTVDDNDHPSIRRMIWMYDRNGRKMTSAPADMTQRCTSMVPMVIFQQLQGEDTECGVTLNIVLATSSQFTAGGQGIESSGLVGQLTASLTNVSEVVRMAGETQAYVNTTIKTNAENVGAPKL